MKCNWFNDRYNILSAYVSGPNQTLCISNRGSEKPMITWLLCKLMYKSVSDLQGLQHPLNTDFLH